MEQQKKSFLPDDGEQIIQIEIERLKTFKDHPFKVQDDEEMKLLKESIEKYGILNPLIVRPLKDGGAWYQISPWGLSWDDENYYLVGYDTEADQIKHYRVDKMLHINMCEESRDGKEHFKKLDMADYAKKSFGMFGGEEQTVKLLVHNSLAGVVIDRFGKDAMMIPVDEEYFTVNVDVHVSRQFFGWVFSLGEKAKIVGPEEVIGQMQEEVIRLRKQYMNE